MEKVLGLYSYAQYTRRFSLHVFFCWFLSIKQPHSLIPTPRGSLSQSFLYVFRRAAGSCPNSRGVHNSEVSARRESTVYVREIQASLRKKMLNVRYCLNCLTRDVR